MDLALADTWHGVVSAVGRLLLLALPNPPADRYLVVMQDPDEPCRT